MDFSDLGNQLRLFRLQIPILGIQPENYILRSLGGEREFSKQHDEDYIRSIKALAGAMNRWLEGADGLFSSEEREHLVKEIMQSMMNVGSI